MSELIIRIKENGITIEECKNGITSFKPITPDSLLKCIQHGTLRGSVSSGLLPRNCLSFTNYDDGTREITIMHPETRADIRYYDTEYKNFPIMRCIFGFHISNEGKISSCRLGVIADERPRPTTPMFIYPFGNVNGFRLCIGNNPLPPVKSFHTLESMTYHLLSIPHNNDSFRAQNNKLGFEQRTLLEFLKDKTPETYYSEVLVSCSSTLGDFVAGKHME
jgi:hypothetical protein